MPCDKPRPFPAVMTRAFLDTLSTALRQYGRVSSPSPAPSLTRLAIDIARLPWTRPFGVDYLRAFDKVAPFFAGDPSRPEAWTDTIRRVTAHPRARAEVARIIAAQQARRGAPPASIAAAERLADPRAVAVVTGQQAGAFGGPIFTLLKALTAVKLARRVEADHGVPAVPVFWIDAEDHDWDEVASCTVLAEDLAPRTIRLRGPDGVPRPVASVQLDADAIQASLDELRNALPATEFTPALIERLRTHYAGGTGMSVAFGRWLEELLGPLGLVVFDSADPAAKPLVAPVFLRELEAPGDSGRLAAEAGQRMEARGYHAQVTPAPGSVSLFHLDGTREAIRRSGDRFTVGEREVSAADLLEEARSHPERFSPNVLLRPLVQDTLFPTVAYVAGPSEIVYLGQLREIYERFGVPMPLVHPRATATLLDGAALRFLTRYPVELAALQPRDDSALNHLLAQQLPQEVENALADARQAIEERMEAVIASVPSIDPTLEGAARSTLGKMTHELTTLHNKVIQAAKRRDETLRRQFDRTKALAFPNGDPQERAVGFVWLLNRVGPALVEILDRELPLDPGQHWVLAL